MKIWIVRYEHKHGTDIIPCATEERAFLAVKEVMEQNIHDIDDKKKRKEICAFLDANKISEAMGVWENAFSSNSWESFEIGEFPVLTESC